MINKTQKMSALLMAVMMMMPLLSLKAQSQQAQKLDALLNMIAYQYVDSVDEEQLTDDAIRAILKDCDPHSVYISAEDLKDVNEPLVGKFEGIGVQFNILEDTIMVTQTIAGGPSEKLGIRSGDRIVTIEGENVTNIKLTNNDVLKRLRGDQGTKVKVQVYRRGSQELLDFVIVRDKIPLYSVDASYMASPEIGYIKISRFADKTVEEFQTKLKELKEQGMKNLILDLTDNGGGYLNRAIELADEFLSAGKKVVYTEGRTQSRQEYNASAAGGWEKGKLVVLVNESSASASEIVTGAVQDWDRGLVIGRRTFAKGLVQKPYPLPDGSAVRLTIARYYTPSGRCIQKPYEKGAKGDEEYDADLSERFLHGELYSLDSIKVNDSLKYYTAAKRTVYGGGGILPDIFVPLDTSMNSSFYDDLRRKGVMTDFALTYVDDNRKNLLKEYADVFAFKKGFNLNDELLNKFFAYAEKKEVKKDEAGFRRSEKIIRTQLKALIARDLWNTNAYFVVVNDINSFFQKAMISMDDDTFTKMKIAEK
jgi:carboxyl-terminal processing protease